MRFMFFKEESLNSRERRVKPGFFQRWSNYLDIVKGINRFDLNGV